MTLAIGQVGTATVFAGSVVATVTASDGTATDYGTFEDALAAANATTGATITLLQDCSYETNGSGLWDITSTMTIDGNDHTLSGYGLRGTVNDTFAINYNGTKTIDVTFKNLTITNDVSYGRAIDVRGDIGTLILDNVIINSPGSSSQPITYGGYHDTCVNYVLKNGTKILGGEDSYAIITFNPATWTIEDSEIRGWASMYFKVDAYSAGNEGTVVNAKNSKFISVNTQGGNSNSFAAFVFEDDGVTVNLTDCEVSSTMENVASQFAFTASYWASRTSKQTTINVHATNEYENKTKVKDYLFRNEWGSTAKLVIYAGIYHEDPSEYVADGYITIPNDDSSTKVDYPYRVVSIGDKAVAKIEYTYDKYVINPSDTNNCYIDVYYWVNNYLNYKDENSNICPQYLLITDETKYYNVNDSTDCVDGKSLYEWVVANGHSYYLQPSLRKKISLTSSVIYASVENAVGVAQYVTDNSDSTCAITLLKANNAEIFTLPVDTTFDTKGLLYTGTVSAPTGYLVKHVGTVYSVVPETDAVASITSGDTTTKYATIEQAYEAIEEGQSINVISNDTKKSLTENVSPEKPFVDSNTKGNVANDTTVPENSENGIATKVAEIVVNDIEDNSSMSKNNSSDIQTIVNGMDNINNKVADSAQLKITIKSAVSTTTATTVENCVSSTITTKKATYDVKPWVTIETTVGSVTTTTTRIITNDELAAKNAVITFRLPVPTTMTGNIVTVSHYEDGATTADWTKNYNVQTADDGDRYIELSASSFSIYELKQYVETSNGNGGGSYKAPKTCVD